MKFVDGNFSNICKRADQCTTFLELPQSLSLDFYEQVVGATSMLSSIGGAIGIRTVSCLASLEMRVDKRAVSDFSVAAFEDLGNALKSSMASLGSLVDEVSHANLSEAKKKAFLVVIGGEQSWLRQRSLDFLKFGASGAMKLVQDCESLLPSLNYVPFLDADEIDKMALIKLSKSKAANKMRTTWGNACGHYDKVKYFHDLVAEDDEKVEDAELASKADTSMGLAWAEFNENYERRMDQVFLTVGVCAASQAMFGVERPDQQTIDGVLTFFGGQQNHIAPKVGHRFCSFCW